MMKKYRAFLVIAVVLVVGSSLLGFKDKNPTVRQPQIGAHVHPVTKKYLLKKNVVEAKRTAESLNLQVRSLIEASSMNFVERWVRSIDLRKMETQYSEDIARHVVAMTEVMKHRRERGGLRKLQEFDFQNLLRQSDYLVSLNLTATRLWKISSEELSSYKYERSSCGAVTFDKKIASNPL